MKFVLLVCIAAALLGAGLVGTISLHRHGALRRLQVAALQEQRDRRRRAPAEVRPMPITTSAAGETTNASAAAQPAESAKLRAEIAALEKRAEEHFASQSEATDAPATNRDPEKGMTRLEYFRNAGQATPAAAFQTLVWAAMKGNDRAMAQTIGVADGARQEVQELIATLPESEREKYSTPESVIALFLAKAMVLVSAIQVVDTTQTDASNATITVRGLMGNDQTLPMRLGATGWQLWEGEKNVEWLRAEFAGGRGK
jgi:hypothetical protein